MKLQLKAGDKITMIQIGGMAMTRKSEITITGFDEAKQRYTYKEGRKRKEYYLPEKLNEVMLFKGHGLPLLVDTETNKWSGNACFNFILANNIERTDTPMSIVSASTPEQLAEYIKGHQINDEFNGYGEILYTTPDDRDTEKLLFPDQANLHHAVVERIMKRDKIGFYAEQWQDDHSQQQPDEAIVMERDGIDGVR